MNLQEAFDAGFDAVKAYVDGALGDLERRLAAVEAREPLRGEPGSDGIDGKDGANGTDGKDGRDGEPGERGADGLPGERGEVGPQGLPGRDGRDGVAGPAGKDGLNGKDGRDGIDGKDGAPGLNGKDGLGFDDLTIEPEDDGRVIVFRLSSGDRKREFRFTTASAIYRGFYRDGSTYERGDLATWNGSVWHCNVETTDKPGDGSKFWTLAVKKGRDGRDGINGKGGERGPEGRPGRDRY